MATQDKTSNPFHWLFTTYVGVFTLKINGDFLNKKKTLLANLLSGSGLVVQPFTFWAAVIIITYYEAALYSTTMKIGGWGWWVAGVSENEANAASSLP